MTSSVTAMMAKVQMADGFLAALDQSGGSTPKALQAYGVPDDKYTPGEESMFDAVHEMRTRIITSKSFTGDKVLGAILFENTMDREIEGLSTGQYLWAIKGIVPFIKVDQGLAAEENGVQLMKPMPELDNLLKKAVQKNMFGTKMRSVVKSANPIGIQAIVAQQFMLGKKILSFGLVPILEPEVDINIPDKEQAEALLKVELLKGLDALADNESVMLKLSLPTQTNFYKDVIQHPHCICVVALSGGYSRDQANRILAQQEGMIASFSRALLEGLSYHQSPDEFDKTLEETVDSVYRASKAPLA